MNLNIIRTFVKVASLGSFTQAAKALNQPKSRVSRSIATLENELNLQLIRRTTRQTSLTSAGELFYQKVGHLINQLEQEINTASETDNFLTGPLRVTAPEDMGEAILPLIIADYNSAHPAVEIQTLITNDFVDLTKNNVDVGFRIGKLKDSSLIQRKLADISLVMAASPQYLKMNGRPSELKDIERHNFYPFKVYQHMKELKALNCKPSLVSDSFPLLLNLALNDKGIAMLPDFFAKKYFNQGLLERVLPNWTGGRESLHLVYPPTKKMPLKVRAFIDISKEIIAKYI